jgi:hypothetical protein
VPERAAVGLIIAACSVFVIALRIGWEVIH